MSPGRSLLFRTLRRRTHLTKAPSQSCSSQPGFQRRLGGATVVAQGCFRTVCNMKTVHDWLQLGRSSLACHPSPFPGFGSLEFPVELGQPAHCWCWLPGENALCVTQLGDIASLDAGWSHNESARTQRSACIGMLVCWAHFLQALSVALRCPHVVVAGVLRLLLGLDRSHYNFHSKMRTLGTAPSSTCL